MKKLVRAITRIRNNRKEKKMAEREALKLAKDDVEEREFWHRTAAAALPAAAFVVPPRDQWTDDGLWAHSCASVASELADAMVLERRKRMEG